MNKVKIAVLSLLLVTPAAFADEVTINWTGNIFDYAATPDSNAPQSLGSDFIKGKISFDTSLFTTPDAGNPSGIVSFSGNNLFSSTFHWDGGIFKIGTGPDQVLFDSSNNELELFAQDSYTDRSGDEHLKLFTFDLTGYGTKSVGGGVSFLNIDAGGGGFAGQAALDKVHIKSMAAPEIDPGSGLTALSFLAGCLAVIRGRRRPS
jgi:hypothetical protein